MLPDAIRVLCPGAGFLPSLNILCRTLRSRGVKDITFTCVDPQLSIDKFINHHGANRPKDLTIHLELYKYVTPISFA